MVSAMAFMSRNAVQDILNRFHGSWLVTPETDATGQVIGCTAVLEQDVLPRGGSICETYMCHVTAAISNPRQHLLHSCHTVTVHWVSGPDVKVSYH